MSKNLKIRETGLNEMRLAENLFREYADSLDFNLGFQGFEVELATLPGAYAAPKGCILFAVKDSEIAGCIAMRPLEAGIVEMKRLYVKPRFQGLGIGRALAASLVEEAKGRGYEKMRLDTVPSMVAAIQMYRAMGFYPIPPYRENPIPGSVYLELNLRH